MIIYLHGSPDKLPVAEHTVIICPGTDVRQPFVMDKDGNSTGKRAEAPSEWMDEIDGELKPRQIPVIFRHGQAEVEDSVGRYMISRGLAQKTRLVIPNSWNG